MKGKGAMHTYFLIGNSVKSIPLTEDYTSPMTRPPSTASSLSQHTNADSPSTEQVATQTDTLETSTTKPPVDDTTTTRPVNDYVCKSNSRNKFKSKHKRSNVCDIL